MSDDKNKKEKEKDVSDDEALDLNDFEKVVGGRMRDEVVTNDTTDVSADTKKNV